jgi:hypothetical protein
VERPEQGVAETGAAVEKAALAHLEQAKFDEWPSGHTREELLLVKAALVDILGEQGLSQAERPARCAILQDLLGI